MMQRGNMRACRTHGLATSLALLFLLLLLPGLKLLGKTKEQAKPLPPEVLKAKSVYLDCRLPMLNTSFLVKQHLQQWGRFQIEDRHQEADLILTIDGIDSSMVLLVVGDSTYHKVCWSTTAEGGTIPGRCIQLIDLFRTRIEADEASQRKAAPPAQQP
jgi:hypothetical protein